MNDILKQNEAEQLTKARRALELALLFTGDGHWTETGKRLWNEGTQALLGGDGIHPRDRYTLHKCVRVALGLEDKR